MKRGKILAFSLEISISHFFHRRYRHTKEVLEAFQVNTSKAVEWLHETYRKSLQKDVDEANKNVLDLVKKLRLERIRSFSEKVGDKLYVPMRINVNFYPSIFQKVFCDN